MGDLTKKQRLELVEDKLGRIIASGGLIHRLEDVADTAASIEAMVKDMKDRTDDALRHLEGRIKALEGAEGAKAMFDDQSSLNVRMAHCEERLGSHSKVVADFSRRIKALDDHRVETDHDQVAHNEMLSEHDGRLSKLEGVLEIADRSDAIQTLNERCARIEAARAGIGSDISSLSNSNSRRREETADLEERVRKLETAANGPAGAHPQGWAPLDGARNDAGGGDGGEFHYYYALLPDGVQIRMEARERSEVAALFPTADVTRHPALPNMGRARWVYGRLDYDIRKGVRK